MPRKQYTIHYIYKTICIPTGKFYIGMHSTFELEDDYLGSGKRLKYSINKYGKDNHTKEILEFCKDRIELKKREKEIVNEDFIKDKMCMNLQLGGTGGFISEEHKLNFIDGGNKTRYQNGKKYGTINLEKGRLICQERIKNGTYKGKRFEGKKHTAKFKKHIGTINSIKQKGNKNSQFGTCWITKDNKEFKIKNDEIELYLKLGYNKGRVNVEKFIRKNKNMMS